MTHQLTPEIAARFATIALGHVTREYPHKLDHVLDGPEDVLGPRALHPIFFGSFDWHSCVHGWWLLLRLRRLFPNLPEAHHVDALAGEMLGAALRPLASAFAGRFSAYLPKLTYPIRAGTHFNTAFALVLALEWAEAHDPALAATIGARARDYYGGDRACQAWEPGGDDFLSPALAEAMLMRRVLDPDEFRTWFAAFLPDLAAGAPASLFSPAIVSDRSDGKIAHLDGVNLSRAWCWRALAGGLDPGLAARLHAAADAHLEASLPHVAGDYMGEHWLATFALLALEG
jgi:hypothetical protein